MADSALICSHCKCRRRVGRVKVIAAVELPFSTSEHNTRSDLFALKPPWGSIVNRSHRQLRSPGTRETA